MLVACGHGTDRRPPSRAATDSQPAGKAAAVPSRTACGYITEQEASAALGQPSRFRPQQTSAATCSIEPVSGDVFHGTTVDYRVVQAATTQYDFIAAQKGALPVSGLGDRAMWLPAGKTRGNLAVVRGGDVITVTITDLGGHPQVERKARDVARAVLDHL